MQNHSLKHHSFTSYSNSHYCEEPKPFSTIEVKDQGYCHVCTCFLFVLDFTGKIMSILKMLIFHWSTAQQMLMKSVMDRLVHTEFICIAICESVKWLEQKIRPKLDCCLTDWGQCLLWLWFLPTLNEFGQPMWLGQNKPIGLFSCDVWCLYCCICLLFGCWCFFSENLAGRW